MPSNRNKGWVLLAVRTFARFKAAVAVLSHGRIPDCLLSVMKVWFSKSTSAPMLTMLKCVLPAGAAILSAGMKEGIVTVAVPAILSMAPELGA